MTGIPHRLQALIRGTYIKYIYINTHLFNSRSQSISLIVPLNELTTKNVPNSLRKESSTKDKLLKESPRNGFIFSTPAPKTQRFSEREDSDAAADKV